MKEERERFDERDMLELLRFALSRNGTLDDSFWRRWIGTRDNLQEPEGGIWSLLKSDDDTWIIERWKGRTPSLYAIHEKLFGAVVHYYWMRCARDGPWDDEDEIHVYRSDQARVERRITTVLPITLSRAGVRDDKYMIGNLGDEQRTGGSKYCLLTRGDGSWVTLHSWVGMASCKVVHFDGIYASEYFYWNCAVRMTHHSGIITNGVVTQDSYCDMVDFPRVRTTTSHTEADRAIGFEGFGQRYKATVDGLSITAHVDNDTNELAVT